MESVSVQPRPDPGLVFMTLSYDSETSEHLAHKFALLRRLAAAHRIVILANRAKGTTDAKGLHIHRLRMHLLPLRFIEQLAVLLAYRLRGFKRFYAHYNFSGAVAGGIVARLTGGRGFTWDCGIPTYRDYWAGARGPSLKTRLKQVAALAGLQISARSTHYLVTGTRSLASYYEQALKLPAGKCLVVPNTIDLERFRPIDRQQARHQLGLDSTSRIILFLHQLWPRKGPQHLVPIAHRLRELLPGAFQIVVVGAGPYLDVLKTELAEAQLGDSFRIEGPVPNYRTALYYSAADVYLMPSEEEGFPHTLLEAMASGCPFVATNVGGVQDIVSSKQRGFLVPVGDVGSMACRAAQLAGNPLLRDRMSREGQRWAEQFAINGADSFDRVVFGMDQVLLGSGTAA